MAAKQATTTIPVVFAAVGEPVAEELVTSRARPGGNVTGLSLVVPELIRKNFELLKQAIPRATRLALLLKPETMPAATKHERLDESHGAAGAPASDASRKRRRSTIR